MATAIISAHTGGRTVSRINAGVRASESISTIRSAAADQAGLITSEELVINADTGTDINQTTTNQTINFGTVGGNSKVAQSFSPTKYGTIRVTVSLAKVGSPTDNIILALYTDNAGEPGTLITSSALGGAGIINPANLFITTVLTPGTTYWMQVSRSGAEDNANYYRVNYNDSATFSGSMLAYAGGLWSGILAGGPGVVAAFYITTLYYERNLFTALSKNFLSYDLSGIPVGSTITSAYLTLNPNGSEGDDNLGIGLTAANPTNRNITTAEYTRVSDTLLSSYVLIPTLIAAEGSTTQMNLNAAGLTAISNAVGGYIDFALRHQNDITNTALANTVINGGNIVNFSALPTLTVIYTIPSVTVATVITDSINSVTSTGIVAVGEVTDASGPILERGFQYGQTKTSLSSISETGSFSVGEYDLQISGLTPNKTYFIRAWARVNGAVSYGDWLSFFTAEGYVIVRNP